MTEPRILAAAGGRGNARKSSALRSCWSSVVRARGGRCGHGARRATQAHLLATGRHGGRGRGGVLLTTRAWPLICVRRVNAHDFAYSAGAVDALRPSPSRVLRYWRAVCGRTISAITKRSQYRTRSASCCPSISPKTMQGPGWSNSCGRFGRGECKGGACSSIDRGAASRAGSSGAHCATTRHERSEATRCPRWPGSLPSLRASVRFIGMSGYELVLTAVSCSL